MQAGELNTKIRIQKKLISGTGSFASFAWIDIDSDSVSDTPVYIWAKWVNVHGSESWVANSVQAEQGATVTIRYKTGVTQSCRIVMGGTNYEIVSIDNIRQGNQWLEIKVKAAVNG